MRNVLVRPSERRTTLGPVEAVKVTTTVLRRWKAEGRRIPVLTAYDYPSARLLDECGVPVLLVGDSLGMVVLGHPDTTHVTLADMEHHVRAVARARPRSLLVADLPYRSYETPEEALASANRLMAAGAEAVKAEGGREILPQIQALIGAGIPFVGHLGMLPQHVLEEGGYRIKGKDVAQREALLADARALDQVGVAAVVLELVSPPVAVEITRATAMPTIGIGSGPDCDGQVLVTPDLVGTFPWFTPKFVRQRLQGAALMRTAVGEWMDEMGPSRVVMGR